MVRKIIKYYFNFPSDVISTQVLYMIYFVEVYTMHTITFRNNLSEILNYRSFNRNNTSELNSCGFST